MSRKQNQDFRLLLTTLSLALFASSAGATTYYVSSATGSDGNGGLSPADAFATAAHVSSLALGPGDEVRFFCGETWRADPLIITRSGSAGSPIVFSSHPADCADKPVLSGARPISGWILDAGNVYRADLGAGANAGSFPNGLNQLFRGGGRLPFGRWPDLVLPGNDGGYSEIDDHPVPTQITDDQLPAVDWTGARAHVKGIRWYILNREVVAGSGNTLTLNAGAECWGGCTGWGFWLSNHRSTLDQEGEWYYEEAANRVFLYTASGPPADGEIEGSVVVDPDGRYHGGVVLGDDFAAPDWPENGHIAYVTVDNLRLERWFDAGITTPLNLGSDENSDLVLQGNEIVDVDGRGIRLAAWVPAASHGNGPDGWRGGRRHTVRDNLVDGPNHLGIDTYGTSTTIEDNTVRNVGLIANLGRSGMGCDLDDVGECTEDGVGIRLKLDPFAPDHTGHDNLVRHNRLSMIGYHGIDVFGRVMTIEENVVDDACYSKADCGAISTFGSAPLASTPVHDVAIRRNVIRDTLGNTDGCRADFDPLFGFGLDIINFSRDVEASGNTVIGATASGILYQDSTGPMSGNTLYDNGRGIHWGTQARLMGVAGVTGVTQSANVFFSLLPGHSVLMIESRANLAASDGNYFFNPWDDFVVTDLSTGGVPLTLAEWQAWSGQDGSSVSHWYGLGAGDPPRSEIFVNDTGAPVEVSLGGVPYEDLDRQPVSGSLTLAPYSSRILIRGAAIFTDGFESGDTSVWSQSVPGRRSSSTRHATGRSHPRAAPTSADRGPPDRPRGRRRSR